MQHAALTGYRLTDCDPLTNVNLQVRGKSIA